jgi:hypothetical protein
MRKYHKTVDYLILAAELVTQNKLEEASKALIKAASAPGARRALAELDAQQQQLQDQVAEVQEPKSEESKVARALAKALALTAEDLQQVQQPQQPQPVQAEDEDEEDQEEEQQQEEADEVDLEDVELEADNTDGQLMRDSTEQPLPDTTKASVVAKNLRKALHKRFTKK